MTVSTTIPQMPSHETVEVIVSPEDPSELWVLPAPELGMVCLPPLRHLLPEDFRDAPVVDFQPVEGTHGGWILRKAA